MNLNDDENEKLLWFIGYEFKKQRYDAYELISVEWDCDSPSTVAAELKEHFPETFNHFKEFVADDFSDWLEEQRNAGTPYTEGDFLRRDASLGV